MILGVAYECSKMLTDGEDISTSPLAWLTLIGRVEKRCLGRALASLQRGLEIHDAVDSAFSGNRWHSYMSAPMADNDLESSRSLDEGVVGKVKRRGAGNNVPEPSTVSAAAGEDDAESSESGSSSSSDDSDGEVRAADRWIAP